MDRVWIELDLSDYRTEFTIVDQLQPIYKSQVAGFSEGFGTYGEYTYPILVDSVNSDGSISVEYSEAWVMWLDWGWGLYDPAINPNGDFLFALNTLAGRVSELIGDSSASGWSLPSGRRTSTSSGR